MTEQSKPVFLDFSSLLILACIAAAGGAIYLFKADADQARQLEIEKADNDRKERESKERELEVRKAEREAARRADEAKSRSEALARQEAHNERLAEERKAKDAKRAAALEEREKQERQKIEAALAKLREEDAEYRKRLAAQVEKLEEQRANAIKDLERLYAMRPETKVEKDQIAMEIRNATFLRDEATARLSGMGFDVKRFPDPAPVVEKAVTPPPEPRKIFVLRDGKKIITTRAMDGGDVWSVKTEAGKFEIIQKVAVEKIIEEQAERPARD